MTTLTLGPLVLVGMQQGTVVRVSVRSQIDTCDVFLTIPEWSSLAALVDVLGAADKEIARLRAALAGAEGELAGLRVSESFHRDRCDKLEMAAVRNLLPREQGSFKGCCPLCAEVAAFPKGTL